MDDIKVTVETTIRIDVPNLINIKVDTQDDDDLPIHICLLDENGDSTLHGWTSLDDVKTAVAALQLAIDKAEGK